MTRLPTSLDETSLAPAMQFVLSLGRARTTCAALTEEWRRLTELWDLAEQYHPEEAWWTSIYLGGGRSLDDLCERAPRNPLSPAMRRLPAHRSSGSRRMSAAA